MVKRIGIDSEESDPLATWMQTLTVSE